MPDVTLTFDNGPEPDVTPGVLRDLAARGIRATFFVVGSKLRDPARRALLDRIVAEGHWIGNHTFTHSVPLGLRTEPDVAEAEIGATQALIGDLSHPDRFFRPFGGGGNLDRRLLSRRDVDFLLVGKYACVLWNAIPRDWNDPDGWVDRAVGQIEAQPWTLTVLHDLPTGAMRHLDRFLGRAAESGASFRQDFPPECVPIRAGRIVSPIDEFVASP
jgi:peptidoglycan/xylan/chitin deacetylase (PgdA/CDA1 family)